ncbi:MAG: ECF transporter S component [Eubacteriales bacterium]|nr:ECF transporter S component [Eubacteriales bacterium]
MNRKMTALQLCLVAMAVCINVAGGQLALTLRLPIYLDSIGTILTGVLMGPVFGMLPNLLSGLVLGMTTDIYSLYFAPVGMITGLMAGLAGRRMQIGDVSFGQSSQSEEGLAGSGRLFRYGRLFLAALLITIPGTIASSLICAKLFGGITSSGSTVLVQLLAKTPLGMTGSVFVVQIVTDYLDRVISLLLVAVLLRALPYDMKQRWSGGRQI